MTAPAIRLAHLRKTFRGRRALDDVNLNVMPGEMVALIGASGSGKSTLLRHVSGLVAADRGESRVEVFGRLVQNRGVISADIRKVRADISFVFQQFNLVDRLPVITNVLTGMLHRLPAWRSLLRRFTPDDIACGVKALTRVGIVECACQRASTLSGGQQQRAAISRALVQQARIILADEPIASLDPESSRRIMELLAEINRESSVTVVVSLHQVEYAMRYCARTVALRAGVVVYDGPSSQLNAQLLRELYGAQSDELLSSDSRDTGAAPTRPIDVQPAYASARVNAWVEAHI